MMDEKWAVFEKETYLNLETFRKNGEGVKTPVWFMRSGDVLYVRTIDGSAKIKRIRRNARVRIAPCTNNGTLKGDGVEAMAEIAQDAQVIVEAENMAKKKYGMPNWIFTTVSRLRGGTYATIVIRLK